MRAASAPGFRDAGEYNGYGALRNIGAGGYCWASTTSGSSAHYLSFSYSWLGPQYSNSRAIGFPLRCLQEEGCRGALEGWLCGPGLPLPQFRYAV